MNQLPTDVETEPKTLTASMNVAGVLKEFEKSADKIAEGIARKESMQVSEAKRWVESIMKVAGHLGPVIATSWAESDSIRAELHWKLK